MKHFSPSSFRWTSGVLMLILTLALPWAAFADNLVNNVEVDGNDTFTLGSSTTVSYKINATGGDGQQGCNASDDTPATVTLNIPAGVTASTNTLVFSQCNAFQPVTFSASAAGDYAITVASIVDSGPGTYKNQADFTLHVLPPPDTTPPVIVPTVSPAPNANGWNNTEVTVSWSVSDPESGIASSSGCGTTTLTTETPGTNLTCSATNGTGLSNSASVTVNIDKTPPTASASASPGPNANGWNNTNVTVSFSGSDALSGIASCDAPVTLSSEGAGQSASGTCTDKAGNVSAPATASGINIDKTSPTASASASPGPNANGWNNTNVTVSFSGSDALSGIASCDAPVTLSSEGVGQSAAGTCTDKAGNVSAPATASGNIDKTPPTVAFGTPPASSPYLLNQSVTPSYSCSDNLSGFVEGNPVSGPAADCNGPATVDTSSVGSKSYSVTATDLAGNSVSPLVSYLVIYNWNGFFRPVDNPPTLNAAKAGSAIPVKFSLSGNQGLSIFEAGYPRSAVNPCDSTAAVDAVEDTVTAGGSSLSYDASVDQYVYVWKTDKGWAGTCRQLVVKLNDNTEHRANFKFSK